MELTQNEQELITSVFIKITDEAKRLNVRISEDEQHFVTLENALYAFIVAQRSAQ